MVVLVKEDKYQEKLKSIKGARIFAWIGLVVIGILVIATLVTGVMGSKYFLGCLFASIVLPLILYVALWIGRLLHSSSEEKSSNNGEDSIKEKD